MTQFIELKALAGVSYVRAQDVIAVQYNEANKSTLMLAGGSTLSCSEAAKDIMARVEAALRTTSETPHGHASS